MLQQSSRNNFLTRVAGAFSPAALGNKLPGFLLSNPKIFKHENKAQTFTRRFAACSKRLLSFFAFLILFQHLSAQVVSGRVGVFRDSIYVNGKWYNSFSGGGGVGGSGVVGALPYWNSNSTLASSNMNFDGSGRIAVGSSSFDSTVLVNGTLHVIGNTQFQNSINVADNINLGNNLSVSGGRVYIRIGNAVLTNDSIGADINLQGAVAASTFAVNTDTLVFRHLYTIQGTQGTPTVLYVYNQSGVDDTIYLPPINHVFNFGQNISSFLGSSYEILIYNFTPFNVSQSVYIFPNPADSGATINYGPNIYDSIILLGCSVSRFRGWVVGSNKVWLAY